MADPDRTDDHAQCSLDIGCLFHPTAWIENHKKLEEDIETLRAALPLVRLARKLRGASKQPAAAGEER